MTDKPKTRKLPKWMLSKVEEDEPSSYIVYKGPILYYSTIADMGLACEMLISQADQKEELVLALDAEWPVYFNGPGKVALIQVCSDENSCYLFHVSLMKSLPQIFLHLIQHPKILFVGNCIKNDFWKLGKDFDISVAKIIGSGRVIDLGELANKVLNCDHTWSLCRLAVNLLSGTIDKKASVRMSRWNNVLSCEQQSYAATDAYVSGIIDDLQQIEIPTKSYNIRRYTLTPLSQEKSGIIMSRVVDLWNVGRISYKPALQLQEYLAECYKSTLNESSKSSPIKNDVLLLVEHNPVYTVGIRTQGYNAEEENKLKELGAEFFRTNRGGLITFHGPGQLVAYPIMNLKTLEKPGVRCYVSTIEETVIKMCKDFGIKAERSPHTGVWIADKKICAIGIHARRSVSSHGLALNCNTDLTWFDHIVPCGIEGKGVTSLTKELGMEMTVNRTIPHFLRSFSSTFKCKILPFPEDKAKAIVTEICSTY